MDTGQLLATFINDNIPWSITFSVDDQKIISCAYHDIKIWDNVEYKLSNTFSGRGGTIYCIAHRGLPVCDGILCRMNFIKN